MSSSSMNWGLAAGDTALQPRRTTWWDRWFGVPGDATGSGNREKAPSEMAVNRTFHFRSLDGLRVLLAEDNDVSQLVASVHLSNWDIETEVVSNGREVLDCLDRTTYDLVIMDLYMPGLDGYRTTEMIRGQMSGEQSEIPIIGISGPTDLKDIHNAFSLGMNDFVLKPINPNELYRKIIRHTLEN